MRIIKLLQIVIAFFFISAFGSFEKKAAPIIVDDIACNAAEEQERLQRVVEVSSGAFNGDEHMKVVVFKATAARYVRLEALSAVNDFAAATEIAIGRGDVYLPTVHLPEL